MSDQVICDNCGQPIDQTVQYFTATVASVQMVEGSLVAGMDTLKLDYHAEHVPGPLDAVVPTPAE